MLLAGMGTKACRYEKCGKHFVPKNLRQRFCCTQCRTNHNWKHNYYPKHRQPPRWLPPRACPGCGKKFRPEGQGKGRSLQKYCSTNCRTAFNMRRYRAQKQKEGTT